jgi:hypothetical protein
VASCSRDWAPEPQSFPRKACPALAEGREFTLKTFRGAPFTYWIPAFAGMTSVRGRDTFLKRGFWGVSTFKEYCSCLFHSWAFLVRLANRVGRRPERFASRTRSEPTCHTPAFSATGPSVQ